MKNELIRLEIDTNKCERNGSNRCQMQKLLLNQEVASFKFPLLGLVDPIVITELWQSLLAEQPHGLHTIISSRSDWNQRPFFNSMLPFFPKLKKLQLHLVCSDVDLTNIAEQLPNLR